MSMPHPQPTGTPAPVGDDEVIPTAIVIKNIPFSVKRETLLEIIVCLRHSAAIATDVHSSKASLSIPTPYAFNYHLDPMGQFRGLAFANFRVAADADAVVAALNGFDVQGRKLRVEYKKVLQAGEKERIEREKAIRRMRSMQLEKEQQMLSPGGAVGTPYDDGYSLHAPIMSQSRSFSGALPMGGMQGMPVPQPYIHPTQPVLVSSMTTPNLSTQKTTSAAQTELDLNDSATLEIYSRVLLFRDDLMRDELAFSRSLNPKQRRIVHLVAQKLGVYHYSVGEGDERYAVVTRREPHRNSETSGTGTPTSERIGPIRHHSTQALNRSFLSPTSASSANPFSSSTSASSVFQQPSTTTNSSALRTKKSMPDIKSLYTIQPRLNSRASNGNIREGYASFSSPIRRTPSGGPPSVNQIFGGVSGSNIPPVPELGLGAEGGSGSGTNTPGGASGHVVRQPRGPGVGGFLRRRESAVGPTDMSRTPSSMGGLNATTHEPLEI
jgi:RNA recognition motif-containing protein